MTKPKEKNFCAFYFVNREVVLKIEQYFHYHHDFLYSVYKSAMLHPVDLQLFSNTSFLCFNLFMKIPFFFSSMSKETYHVNEERSNSTWRVFAASILCCLSIVLLLLCLKYFAFDDHVKEYGNLANKNWDWARKKNQLLKNRAPN